LYERLKIRRLLGLYGRHDNVLTALVSAPGFI
jgi:hypothetical protein